MSEKLTNLHEVLISEALKLNDKTIIRIIDNHSRDDKSTSVILRWADIFSYRAKALFFGFNDDDVSQSVAESIILNGVITHTKRYGLDIYTAFIYHGNPYRINILKMKGSV